MLIQVKKHIHLFGEVDLSLGKQRSHLCISLIEISWKRKKISVHLFNSVFLPCISYNNHPLANNIS